MTGRRQLDADVGNFIDGALIGLAASALVWMGVAMLAGWM